ncbi:MAG: hypothetical protein IKU85_02345 [Bacteroidaceae bacterium]|nr:hypothetical protein [Bacteroidaceae bacterium]
MKNFKFWAMALFFLVAGLGFTACSEDKEIPEPDVPAVEEELSPAGEDFYMYVNEAWHKNLGEVTTTQGAIYDAAEEISMKADLVLDEMEEARAIMNSYERLMDGEQDANVEFADSILQVISDAVDAAETKEELGLFLGECVRKGYIDNMFRLYAAPTKHGAEICYTLAPDVNLMSMLDAGEDEEEEGFVDGVFGKRFSMGRYEKYTVKTRSGNDFMSCVAEGVGIDPKYFVMEDTMAVLYDGFNQSSLEELKEMILQSAIMEFYLYCGDDYVQEITEGSVSSTYDVLKKQLPNLLTYPLSYYFCQKYVNDEVKAEYTAYAENMRSMFAKRIETNAWLTGQTKQAALDKLENMKFVIGEPEEWDLESFPQMRGELLIDDILEAKQSRNRTIESLIGKDKHDESAALCILTLGGLGMYQYNAGYIRETNSMLILPAFMMEPEYTSDMDIAKKYALFYVIGHEMTHGFDIHGSEYDANGDLNDWWEPSDKEKFLALNKAFAQQISTIEVAPGIMAPGSQTVSEDVADLGGFNIAFDALNEALKQQGVSGEEQKKAQKTFFEHHAFRYRTEYDAQTLQRLLSDVHSLAKVRVNGMVQHMGRWYDLYNVTGQNAMYLPEDKRITIW